MLHQLYIKNYALIDELRLDLSDHLTVITGETGAGKSIILGALSLILGQRAPTNALHENDRKCIIEGTFDLKKHDLSDFFDEYELDYDERTIIRREITPSGRSRAFVNDTPVNLPTLKTLGDQLVNLHAQHQTLHLFNAKYHLQVIDLLAAHSNLIDDYQQLFKKQRKDKNTLAKLRQEEANARKELDFLLFQLSEFEEAELTDAKEQERLEKELKRLSNVEDIQRALLESKHCLEEGEVPVITQLEQVRTALQTAAKSSDDIKQIKDRVDSVLLELQDIANDCGHLEEELLMDPERQQEIETRLDLIYRLQKKHGVQTLEALIQIEQDLGERTRSTKNMGADMERLEKAIQARSEKLLKIAQRISKGRAKQIPALEKQVNQLLSKVGMPNANIKVAHEIVSADHMSPDSGIDQLELLFATNKGSQHHEIRKVASGGELSRLMLCIQTVVAEHTSLPCLIFDEIDTGISGETALQVGEVMRALAENHQVICITHLPQIASKGAAHYFVYKDNSGERTITRVRSLDKKDRVKAIARMLSGDKPGQMALANAEELLAG